MSDVPDIEFRDLFVEWVSDVDVDFAMSRAEQVWDADMARRLLADYNANLFEVRPRMITHTVSVAVTHSPILPVPFAEPGTVMSLTRAQAEWTRAGTDPWRLHVVTVNGATNTGDGIIVEYFPSNPSKKPPTALSDWIASTHPARQKRDLRS